MEPQSDFPGRDRKAEPWVIYPGGWHDGKHGWRRESIKFDIEIVSAEIKIDTSAAIVAFGQAAAYRLFSTKVYIAMPVSLGEEDLSRLESLCMLFGIGLAVFSLNNGSPDFSIRMRAQRYSPDMFYVNEFADRLNRHDPSVYQKLFG